MSVKVEFPPPRSVSPGKGTAGLPTQGGGACTTISYLREAGKATGNPGLVKSHIE